MAFPTISGTPVETQLTTAGTSFTIGFTQTTGELVVIAIGLSGSSAISALGDGFTDLTAVTNTHHIIYKVLDGSEGGDVIVTLGTSRKGAAIAYNIAGQHASQMPEASAIATGSSTDPNPDVCTPTGGAKDYLWIATCSFSAIEEADDDTWLNAAPANYGSLLQKTTGTGGLPTTNGMVGTAHRTLNAASEDPGAFGPADTTGSWRAFTVAVHPAAAAVASMPYRNPYPQILAH